VIDHGDGDCLHSVSDATPTTFDVSGRLGINFSCPGATKNAPPLPLKAQQDGWWAIDHKRVKVGAQGSSCMQDAVEAPIWLHAGCTKSL